MYLPFYLAAISALVVFTMVFLNMISCFFEIRWNRRILFCCASVSQILILLSVPMGTSVIKNLILITAIFFCLCMIFIKPPFNYFVFPFLFTEAYVFIIVSFCGLTFGIFSQFTKLTLSELYHSPLFMPLGMSIAFVSSFLFLLVVMALPNFASFSKLMEKTTRMSVLHLIGICFVDLISLSATLLYYKIPTANEGCEMYILLQITLIAIFILFHVVILSATKIIEIDIQNEQMDQMLDEQILQYKAYARYTSSMQTFQNQYKLMMGNVYTAIQQGDYVQAKQEIDQINEKMYQMPVHSQYSNHIVIDAMLQSFANQCIEQKIPFHATVCIPRDVHPEITDRDVCTICHLILTHLFNHLLIPPGQSGIKFSSSYKNNWLSIRVQCYADSKIAEEAQPASLSPLLDSIHGILSTDYNKETSKYDLILSLPGINSKKGNC